MCSTVTNNVNKGKVLACEMSCYFDNSDDISGSPLQSQGTFRSWTLKLPTSDVEIKFIATIQNKLVHFNSVALSHRKNVKFSNQFVLLLCSLGPNFWMDGLSDIAQLRGHSSFCQTGNPQNVYFRVCRLSQSFISFPLKASLLKNYFVTQVLQAQEESLCPSMSVSFSPSLCLE